MKRFLIVAALGAVISGSSAIAASFTILNASQTLGQFPTLTAGVGQTVQTETFTGNITTFSNFTFVGDAQAPYRTLADNKMFDRVSQTGPESTIWALNSLTDVIYGWGGTFNLGVGGNGSQLKIIVRFTDNTTAVVAGEGCDSSLHVGCTTTGLNQYDAAYGWAFISDTAISQVIIESNLSANSERYSLDDMQVLFGPANDPGPGPGPGPVVPEPSSFGLMGLAMVGLGLLRKVRK